ncbi:hypothetical protein VULLAG_LOCUS19612 [Vulpes lagopus]|uniref:translation initiation factor IF-2-like n=1 Tax=Vulpes lagopus TaxID=494514 RepID=UPI001BCA1852|nr:translation initiation factor IF-2-like [Vulpes lagopus]
MCPKQEGQVGNRRGPRPPPDEARRPEAAVLEPKRGVGEPGSVHTCGGAGTSKGPAPTPQSCVRGHLRASPGIWLHDSKRDTRTWPGEVAPGCTRRWPLIVGRSLGCSLLVWPFEESLAASVPQGLRGPGHEAPRGSGAGRRDPRTTLRPGGDAAPPRLAGEGSGARTPALGGAQWQALPPESAGAGGAPPASCSSSRAAWKPWIPGTRRSACRPHHRPPGGGGPRTGVRAALRGSVPGAPTGLRVRGREALTRVTAQQTDFAHKRQCQCLFLEVSTSARGQDRAVLAWRVGLGPAAPRPSGARLLAYSSWGFEGSRAPTF